MLDAPTYTNIVANILVEIDMLLHNFVYNGYAALADYLRVPLGIITALYITIFGYSIMMGWVRVSMGNFVKAVLKIGFIYLAVTSWSWVSEYGIGTANGVITRLGDALIGASPVHIPGIGGIDGAMQTTLIQFTKLGSVVFDSGGLSNFGGWLGGIIIWVFGYLIVGIGLFEIILAKVMLAVLFVFTPLLVLFCYFKPFQSIFDRWLGAIIGFALLQLFVTAALTLALSLAYWWIALYIGESALDIGNYGTLPIVIVGIICIGLVWKAAHLAQNLGGIVSTSAASAMVGGMVGGAVGASLSTLNVGRLAMRPATSLMGLGKGMVKSSYSGAKSIMKDVRSSLRRGDSDDEKR